MDLLWVYYQPLRFYVRITPLYYEKTRNVYLHSEFFAGDTFD
jgi:hypothetical protein